jgi:hypothetical protein
MREIKFRGYLPEDKVWKYGYYYKGVVNMGMPLCLGDCLIRHCIITDDGTMWHLPSSKTVGMMVAVDDKGTEIYQGDKLLNKNDETALIIEWCEDTLSWCIARRDQETGELYQRHSFCDLPSKVIIGNIYENEKFDKGAEDE